MSESDPLDRPATPEEIEMVERLASSRWGNEVGKRDEFMLVKSLLRRHLLMGAALSDGILKGGRNDLETHRHL